MEGHKNGRHSPPVAMRISINALEVRMTQQEILQVGKQAVDIHFRCET